ncbi:hypothetical protein KSP40_PGU004130 [Platanthera guangdongensis]|uniref:OTU1-like C-terminal C2H2-type zinc finger domain-containing protein n=1 Tax=Platanthera guangdongensis TaxID=2320717 RepID=A0ABR2M548_9ASPA
MAGLSLRCGDCGVLLRSVQEAQEHAELTSHADFSESTEPVLNLVCSSCGKPCRTKTESDLHTKRTGHVDFTDKTMEAAEPIELEAPKEPAVNAATAAAPDSGQSEGNSFFPSSGVGVATIKNGGVDLRTADIAGGRRRGDDVARKVCRARTGKRDEVTTARSTDGEGVSCGGKTIVRSLKMVIPEVDKKLLEELESMGFPTARATRALHYSASDTGLQMLSEERPKEEKMEMVEDTVEPEPRLPKRGCSLEERATKISYSKDEN